MTSNQDWIMAGNQHIIVTTLWLLILKSNNKGELFYNDTITSSWSVASTYLVLLAALTTWL